MHLVANVHMFPHPNPRWDHRAGAEMFMYRLLDEFCKRGHTATVIVNNQKIEPDWLGHIRLLPVQDNAEEFVKADVLLTHLDYSQHTMDLATFWNKPCVHIVHNHTSVDRFQLWRKSDLFVFAANWLLAECKDRVAGYHCTVCYPQVPVLEYRSKTPLSERNAVLLSNLNENKGGDLLQFVAHELPDVKFIGIQGAYGDQRFSAQRLPNVELVPHTPNVQQYYDRARVVWIPSRYESFGMVAAEALHANIPVACTATPGLLECVGLEGAYLVPLDKRDFLNYWIPQLQTLMTDDRQWHHWSNRAAARSLQIQAIMKADCERTLTQIEQVVVRHRQSKGHYHGSS